MAEYIKKDEAIKLIREDKVEITPNLLTIARFAAPNGYSAEDCYKAINDTCDRHIKEIRNLPGADVIERKKGEWIPVTERLPEDDVPVLACYVGYHSHLLRPDLLACRYEDEWCHWDGEPCSYEKCKVTITHWMPLPELPRVE